MLLEVSFFCFNKIYNVFLRKLQQSNFYTQSSNYSEGFAFKPISKHLNILVGCTLSFTRSLNASYLEMDE